MTDLMYCGSCGLEMERQPLGQWHKACTCKQGRYWTDVAPTPKDRRTFYQLTGKGINESPPDEQGRRLFEYGRSVI